MLTRGTCDRRVGVRRSLRKRVARRRGRVVAAAGRRALVRLAGLAGAVMPWTVATPLLAASPVMAPAIRLILINVRTTVSPADRRVSGKVGYKAVHIRFKINVYRPHNDAADRDMTCLHRSIPKLHSIPIPFFIAVFELTEDDGVRQQLFFVQTMRNIVRDSIFDNPRNQTENGIPY